MVGGSKNNCQPPRCEMCAVRTLTAPQVWRQWMPLYVDDFLGSHDLHSMTPEEFKGYTLLILQQWRSETAICLYMISGTAALLSQGEWERVKGDSGEVRPNRAGLRKARCHKSLNS